MLVKTDKTELLQVTEQICGYCGHRWLPRKRNFALSCPKCQKRFVKELEEKFAELQRAAGGETCQK